MVFLPSVLAKSSSSSDPLPGLLSKRSSDNWGILPYFILFRVSPVLPGWSLSSCAWSYRPAAISCFISLPSGLAKKHGFHPCHCHSPVVRSVLKASLIKWISWIPACISRLKPNITSIWQYPRFPTPVMEKKWSFLSFGPFPWAVVHHFLLPLLLNFSSS